MKGDDSLFLHMKGPFAISITILCLLLIAGLRGMSYLKSKDALYKAEKALYDQYLANQEEHIKNIIEADKSIRSFRHDINAHLSALESCIDEKDYDELQNYIDRMKEETQNRKAQSYSGYAAVDTIIAEWHEKALKEEIAWEWKGKLREDLKIELFDLCVLFSNILSNAVEAAEKTEIGGERYIKVSIGSFRGRTSIRVTNTCINSSSQRMDLRTSKVDKDNHGFGMKNIKRIVEKYNGEIVYNFKNNVFNIEVTI
ncbi:MAG: ATP-binding protein [Lachnospiraceae bacterium]|nr:ATP-binding protein [Lachnospiraceae bacterium]